GRWKNRTPAASGEARPDRAAGTAGYCLARPSSKRERGHPRSPSGMCRQCVVTDMSRRLVAVGVPRYFAKSLPGAALIPRQRRVQEVPPAVGANRARRASETGSALRKASPLGDTTPARRASKRPTGAASWVNTPLSFVAGGEAGRSSDAKGDYRQLA